MAARIFEFWIRRPLVLTHSPVSSAWRSVQIAKTLRNASSEPSTISTLTRRRRPRLIGVMVYVTYETGGNSPHHGDYGRRAEQRRFLCRSDGLAPGEEDRQPGQP